MQPIARVTRAAVRARALRDLVLVVRKQQIDAAAVDVDRLAEVRLGHRRAFDVPTGPAAPPRARPTDGVLVRRLPEHEVAGVAFVRRDLDARARDHVVAVAARQPAVVGEARHGEQHVPFGLVSVARRDQPLDQRDDLRQVIRHARLDVGRLDAEHAQVLVERREIARRQHADLDAFGFRGIVDLVVDVRDVARVRQRVRTAQQPLQHVEDDGRPRVADVRVVVDRRPADVHRHALRIGLYGRLERLARPRQRVMEKESHRRGFGSVIRAAMIASRPRRPGRPRGENAYNFAIQRTDCLHGQRIRGADERRAGRGRRRARAEIRRRRAHSRRHDACRHRRAADGRLHERRSAAQARSRPARLIIGAAAARCSGTRARRAASCRKSSSS